MNIPVVNVIMAGGSGERFWPLSRKNRPKQLLYLTNNKKRMIEEAIDRMLPLVDREHIFIATNTQLQKTMRDVLKSHPKENIIGEPVKRNTTGCLVFAAAHLLARFDGKYDDMMMAVTTADHLIRDENRFRNTVSASLHCADQHKGLVTIGVQPTRPETGYGYIQIDDANKPAGGHQEIPFFKAERFLEKPDVKSAEEYYSSGSYFWNSGMFFWKLSTFISSLEMAIPKAAEAVYQLRDCMKKNDENGINSVFESLPDISIDFGLMENAENVYVVPGQFQWDDVGSWDSLSRYHQTDEKNNTLHGGPVVIDCENVTVYNEPGADEMAVSVVGVKDLIVITTKDGVLVCSKGQSQDVRKAVKALNERGSSQL